MLLEARKTRKLVTDFDDTVFIGLEEEAHVAIVDYGNVLIFCGLARRQLNVSVYPGLYMLDVRVE